MERSDTLPRSGSDAAEDDAAAGADDPTLLDRDAAGDGRKRRRKRNSKNPDTLLIEALSSVVISTEAQIKKLSAQQERLKAQHDALCGAITCLEGLIYATRPLRRAARRAARGGGAAAAAAAAAADADLESEEEEWSELRELFRELKEQQPGGAGGGGGTGEAAPGGSGGGAMPLSGSVSGGGAGAPPAQRDGSASGGAGERSSSPAGSSGDGSSGDGSSGDGSSGDGSSGDGSGGTGTHSGGGGGTTAACTTAACTTAVGIPRRTASGSATPAAPLVSTLAAAAAAAAGSASPGARSGSAGGCGACSGIGPPPQWARYIGNDDPDGAFGPGGPSSDPGGSGGGPSGGGGPPCPVALLARLRAMTAPDVARRVQRYVHVCSVDLLRVKGGARDAAVAEARLAEQLDRLMAFSGALLAANPMVLGAVAVYRLDTLQPYGEADTPGRDLWRFALKQAGLTARQELSMTCLMQLYKSRLAALIARRGELLAMQSSYAHDTEAQSEVLALLEQLQLEYSYTTLAFPNALYSCILQPHQAAAIWAGAFPYIPQMLVLDQALCSLQAEAATAHAFRSPAALPPLPPAPQHR